MTHEPKIRILAIISEEVLNGVRKIHPAADLRCATPRNHSLVRLCLNTKVSIAEIERVIAVCREIRGIVRPDRWPALVKRRASSNVEYFPAAAAE